MIGVAGTLRPSVTTQAKAEIKDSIKATEVEVHIHWVQAHMGHTYNERADALAKATTTRQFVHVEVKVIRCQVKKHLLGRALSIWQERWSNSDKGRVTYELFP